jgi:hypothetical protein
MLLSLYRSKHAGALRACHPLQPRNLEKVKQNLSGVCNDVWYFWGGGDEVQVSVVASDFMHRCSPGRIQTILPPSSYTGYLGCFFEAASLSRFFIFLSGSNMGWNEHGLRAASSTCYCCAMSCVKRKCLLLPFIYL